MFIYWSWNLITLILNFTGIISCPRPPDLLRGPVDLALPDSPGPQWGSIILKVVDGPIVDLTSPLASCSLPPSFNHNL